MLGFPLMRNLIALVVFAVASSAFANGIKNSDPREYRVVFTSDKEEISKLINPSTNSTLIGGVLEAAAAGSGLHRGFTVVCNVCQARTLVGASCEKCSTALGISLPVRVWARLTGPGRLRRGRVSFGAGVLASVVFVIAT